MNTRLVRISGLIALVWLWSTLAATLIWTGASSRPAVAAPTEVATSVTPELPTDPRLVSRVATALDGPATQSWAPSIDGLRIVVPRLGIDLPLAMGDIERDVPRAGYAGGTPEALALVFPSVTPPGGVGNTYVYAHARTGMFLSLWSARVDDAVLIVRSDRTMVREYRVATVMPRVDPTDTRWLDAGGTERLTLQTSTGPRPQDPRFIVIAYPAGPLATKATAP